MEDCVFVGLFVFEVKVAPVAPPVAVDVEVKQEPFVDEFSYAWGNKDLP